MGESVRQMLKREGWLSPNAPDESRGVGSVQEVGDRDLGIGVGVPVEVDRDHGIESAMPPGTDITEESVLRRTKQE